MERTDIVIVGGGLAGATVAEQYRKNGGRGSVAIISADEDLPVHRPPLSKEYLRGEETRDKVFVKHPTFYSDNNIAVRTGVTVESIDRGSMELTLAGGESVAYQTLVLATGASPRHVTVPGADLPGVFYLRSLASADLLRDALSDARTAVIIGAGFIGMEVAATLTQRGINCTVVEMGPRIWPRLVPESTAHHIQQYFESRGVSFRFGRSVRALTGDRHVQRVVLDTGEALPADVVVAGVGVTLNTELAQLAGLAVDGGILVDEYFRTADPNIYAVGDVARFPDRIGGSIHLEHWDNAVQQGRALGQTLAGTPAPFEHVAYFFSDLFDLSINMIGYPLGWDETALDGDPASGAFTTLYGKNGHLRAALMVNDDAKFGHWTEAVKTGRQLSAFSPQLASQIAS